MKFPTTPDLQIPIGEIPIQQYRMEEDYQCDFGGPAEDWLSFPVLYTDAVRSFPSGSVFVELGCHKGRSVNYMARQIRNSGKDIKLYCVDTWKENAQFDLFLHNTRMFDDIVIPIRSTTQAAAEMFADESIDFLFIDAGHDFDSVKLDLELWSNKIKIGGIMSGHDYDSHEGVKRAVRAFFGHDNDLSDRWGECCFVTTRVQHPSGGNKPATFVKV